MSTLKAVSPLSHHTRQDEFPREECIAWMREWSSVKKGPARCVVFSLSSMAREQGEDAASITHVESPEPTVSDRERTITLEAAADEIWRAAKAWSGVAGMRTGLMLQGHQAGRKLEDGTQEDPLTVIPRVSFPFTATPPPGVRENFEGGELPNASGSMAIMQRHADTVQRTAHTTLDKQQDRLLEFNRDLMHHVERLRELSDNQALQIQDALDRKVTREIQARDAAFNLALKEQVAEVVFDQVLPLVTLVTKAKLGIVPAQPVDGQGPGDPLVLVRQLQLKPKQLAKFVGSLDERQRQALSPVVAALHKEMAPEQQEELFAALKSEEARLAREKAQKTDE